MFDIGFWEISLIGVIALLVIGPERLPGVARNVGFWVGRMRRYVGQVRSDIEREVRADELKRIMNDSAGIDDLREVVEETRTAVADAGRQLDDAGRSWTDEVATPSAIGDDTSGDPVTTSAAGDAAALPADTGTAASSSEEAVTPAPADSATPIPPAEENSDDDVTATRKH